MMLNEWSKFVTTLLAFGKKPGQGELHVSTGLETVVKNDDGSGPHSLQRTCEALLRGNALVEVVSQHIPHHNGMFFYGLNFARSDLSIRWTKKRPTLLVRVLQEFRAPFDFVNVSRCRYLPSVYMIVRVITYRVAVVHNALKNPGVSFDIVSDAKEGCLDLLVAQQVKYKFGGTRNRPIVESEKQVLVSCIDFPGKGRIQPGE